MSELTIEQKVIKYLGQTGFMTNSSDIWEAMKNPEYAKWLMTGNGLKDEIEEEGYGDQECNHEALSNDEIQIVFDNDEE